MQKLMGLVRRCVDDYNMISEGDRIAVGVSGGKDSLVLLVLACNAGDPSSIPGLGRSTGEGIGYPFQYYFFGLQNHCGW